MYRLREIMESIPSESKKIFDVGSLEDVSFTINKGIAFRFTGLISIPSGLENRFDSLFSVIYKEDISIEFVFVCRSNLFFDELEVDRYCSFYKDGKELDISELTNDEDLEWFKDDVLDFFEYEYGFGKAFNDVYEQWKRG